MAGRPSGYGPGWPLRPVPAPSPRKAAVTATSVSSPQDSPALEPPVLGAGERLVDRILGGDPGLVRLQTATRAVVAMGSALGVEWLFRSGLPAGGGMNTLLALLIGAVLAMMGSMGLGSGSTWHRLRTGLTFPLAMGTGLTLGALLSGHPVLGLAGFVLVMFAAVAIRRFGMPFFFFGFMGWMGYFFATFLHVTLGQLPALLEDAAVAAAWVVLLTTTVLRGNPQRDLRRTVRAFGARGRGVAAAAAELLAREPSGTRRALGGSSPRRRHRRLQRRLRKLGEATLFVEGHLADPAALPPGWYASELRRRVVDLELAVEEMARSAVALAGGRPARGGPAAIATSALRALAARDLARAEEAADALRGRVEPAPGGDVPDRAARSAALHLAAAVDDYVAVARAWRATDERARRSPRRASRDGGTDTSTTDDGTTDDGTTDEDFEAAVDLMMGNLPSSAKTAAGVTPRGARWNPLIGLSQTSRQAWQAALSGALAIAAGEGLSHQRYYWAVIAAFVAFTGTATRSETVAKAVNRVLGTMAGLGVSLVLAHLTSGNTAAVLATILASVFCGFYLQRVSYAYMIFFVTILIGQLYGLLGTLSAGLLVLRLEETAVGAACGILVGLVFLPVSTRDAARTARAAWFGALADLLDAATADRDERPDPDGLARGMGAALHQLVLIATPLTGPLALGSDSGRIRRRLAFYATVDSHARSLVPALRHTTEIAPGPAVACTAAAARALASMPPSVAEARGALASAREALDRCADGDRFDDPALHSLARLQGALRALVEELAGPGGGARR